MIGRREDEADLRDAWFLRAKSDALGPAGEHLRAWRMLASNSTLSVEGLRRAALCFGLSPSNPLTEIFELTEREDGNPVRAAAQMAATVSKLNPAAEFLGLWMADFVLARRLRWPQPVPLLAAKISDPTIRRAADARTSHPEDESWEKVVALAYAQSAASAIDLAGDLGRRADKLLSQRAKLRAKGAGKVVDTLLEDDALAPAARIGGMSDRAMRRIVDRTTSDARSTRAKINRTSDLPSLRTLMMGRHANPSVLLDTELDETCPRELRWRVWMGRVEAVIFAAPKPVTREVLARVVGKGCNLEALIEDIRTELVDRPYELVAVAGGWQHRTRKDYADAIRVAAGVEDRALELSKLETLVLTAIAYFQPATRRELGDLLGREVSRDMLADLRSFGLIANGPKSPRAGAPNTYVTTVEFLSRFGLNSLQDLPDRETIENAGVASPGDVERSNLDEVFGMSGETAQDQETFEEAEFLKGGSARGCEAQEF